MREREIERELKIKFYLSWCHVDIFVHILTQVKFSAVRKEWICLREHCPYQLPQQTRLWPKLDKVTYPWTIAFPTPEAISQARPLSKMSEFTWLIPKTTSMLGLSKLFPWPKIRIMPQRNSFASVENWLELVYVRS